MESSVGIKNFRGTISRKRNPMRSSFWLRWPRVFPTIRIDKSAGKEKYQLLQGEIRKGEEEKRMGKMLGLRQGACTRWESMINQEIKWSNLWRNDVAIKFLKRSVYDTLHKSCKSPLMEENKILLASVMWVYWIIKVYFEYLPNSTSEWTLQMVP